MLRRFRYVQIFLLTIVGLYSGGHYYFSRYLEWTKKVAFWLLVFVVLIIREMEKWYFYQVRSTKYPIIELSFLSGHVVRRHFQHAHFIPMVGVGKRGVYIP